MKTLEIQGSLRKKLGKGNAKISRLNDSIPCVLYGSNNHVHFETHINSFKELIYTRDATFVDLSIEGKSYPCVLQDVQFHPISDKILHADFYSLDKQNPVIMNIPVELEGRAPGVVAGGNLRFVLRKLRIKALPDKMPEVIKVDISNLKIGSKIYLNQLHNENYTFMHSLNAVVVAVRMSRVALTTEIDSEDKVDAEDADEENKSSD